MKKLFSVLGLLIITGLVFTSCSTDEEDPLPPALTFLTGTEPNRVSGDVTLETSEPFIFGFTAVSQSDKNLSRILVVRDYENVSPYTMLDSTLSAASITKNFTTVAYPTNPGTEVFTVTATDKNGLSTSISFTVTTVAADPGISIYTNISLGSYTSSTNSSFASITGETFSMAQAQDPAVQAKIDWVYFHGATYGHTLMSPSNDNIYPIYPAIEDWTTQKTTKFGKAPNISEAAYNQIANKNVLVLTIQNAGVTLNQNFLSELLSNPTGMGFDVGDVLAFETQEGNQGLIILREVNSASPNGNSTIKYDLKVEKAL